MYTVAIIFIGIAVLVLLLRLLFLVLPYIQFVTVGFKLGFAFSDIRFLWTVADDTSPEAPCALFKTVSLLDKAVSAVLKKAERNKTLHSSEVQSALKRLYELRTRLVLDPGCENGIKDTRYISKGQELRILLRGVGVFHARIMQSGRQLIISLPLENGELTVSGGKWLHKKVVVYFHRKGDAFYVFDTVVARNLLFNGRNALALAHSFSLLRSQKRKSVRCKCSVPATLFLGARKREERLQFELTAGFKCMLEDISEDGALIRIGGKGKSGMIIKLQFKLDGKKAIMYGVSKSVSYDKETDCSRIHFQCLETSPYFKNVILGYVYGILPEKEVTV